MRHHTSGSSTRRTGRWWPVCLVCGLALVVSVAVPWSVRADDGPMFRHPVSRTPDMESEDAQLSMMQFYVPAAGRNGEPVLLEYYADRDGDNQPDELIETREYAKPLISSYFDEIPVGAYKAATLGTRSGVEIGPEVRRDAFAAFSLDDGKTWKERNLSESALETSFTLENGIEYPGDVPEVMHSIAGNKILVAWTSKYCSQGSPRYSVKADTDVDGNGELDDPLYPDLFDVAGNQGSIDYAEWMHHGTYPFAEVGEIPFSCVWTARGTLQQVVNPQTGVLQWGVLWRKAERITSGKRDAYYLAMDGVEGAGFVLAWQEDPEGLRPGYGEGPGIGWSGATVNHKTDIWYTHIGWDDFDVMQDPDGNPTLDPSVLDSNKPKVYERMAMPVRLTDNYNCLADRVDQDGNPHPGFCFEDFDGNGVADFCADVFQWTNSQGAVKNICVTEDGRLLNGQIGSSRTRLMLEGYTRADGTKSAWVVLAYEETKGLGAGHTDIEPLDIGKDTMYHSFDMFTPDIAAPGTMLNMPETDPLSDPENPTLLPLILNDKDEYQYQTSIGRRPSLVVQPGYKIAEAAAANATYGMTSAIILYKDGLLRQGGPSDIFMRRIVLPPGFDPAVDNPYDPKYLACDLADTAIVTTSPSA
ncbi:MAG: choice-of-anchor O protein, partial [Acidobacteriota bacterium]